MIGFMYVIAVFVIGVGAFQLFFPDKASAIDRYLAESKGYKPHQGGAYEGRRIFSAFLLIGVGIALIIITNNLG